MIKPNIPKYVTNKPSGYVQTESGHNGPFIPQQKFSELMRDFDPNDPANKNRTFEKMVEAANKKHLNPGEQSFHYYVEDGDVHGFVAIGNINDKLPHIIITDTGYNNTYSYLEAMSALDSSIERLLEDVSDIKAAITGSGGNIVINNAVLWEDLDADNE